MRDYAGVPFPMVEDPLVRKSLATIDYFLRDSSRGFSRIQVGQIPDGSGRSIGSLGDDGTFFKLAGRENDQVAHGGTGPSGTLTLVSTSDPAKGSIFFGSDETAGVFNESNGRFGFGTVAPETLVHVNTASLGTSTLGGFGTVLQRFSSADTVVMDRT